MTPFQYWARWIAFGLVFLVAFFVSAKWYLVNPIIEAILTP
jgi:hypothetical protein